MKVLIIGGGKVGYYLAQTLTEHDHEPVVIESNKSASRKIADALDIPIICGDGTSIDVLESANIEKMDAVISVTGKDEDNLISCQLAKKRFNVPKTIARVNNPKNVQIMRTLGVDIAVSSTDNIARLIEREVDATAIRQVLALNQGEATISEIKIPEPYQFNGYTLSQIKMPNDTIIVSITRNNELIIPRGNTKILSGDSILILSKVKALHDVKKLLELE